MAKLSLEEAPPYVVRKKATRDYHDKYTLDSNPPVYEPHDLKSKHVVTEKDINYRKKKAIQNEKAAAELNRKKGIVMSALEKQASSTPITGEGYKEAVDNQRQKALDKAGDYKKMIRSLATLGELGLSGGTLLGAYANYKNWANAASLTKQTIANLLQKAQLPMQVGGTLIDGYQTYDAIQRDDMFDRNYNATSAGLGVAGSVGAADLFRNARLNYPYIDRVLDTMGVLQAAGDFVKFGWDTYNNTKPEMKTGGIYIQPSKRGTFSAAARNRGMGVQEFANTVLRNKTRYSPAMIKKANFARNASKWN